MSFSETLANRRKSAVAVFHQFRIEARGRPIKNVFVEGFDDLAFYSFFMGSEGKRFRMTFGKRNMDRIIQWFYAEGFNDTDTIFVRDSDFDKFIGDLPVGDHVFTTCGYSVENYICAPNALKRYLKERLCTTTQEFDADADVSHFDHLVTELFRWSAPLMGAIIKRKRSNLDVNLDVIDLVTPFTILLRGEPLPPFDKSDYCVGGIEISDFTGSIEDGIAFTAQTATMWLRGHQFAKIVSAYLESRHQFLAKEFKSGKISQFNKRASSNYDPNSTIEKLIPFADGTEELRQAVT